MNAHDERRQIRNTIRKDKRYQNFITNLHKEEAIQCLIDMGACDSKEELYENLLHEPYSKKIVVQMNRNNLHFKFIEPKRNGEYRHRLLTDLLYIILKGETLPFLHFELIKDKYQNRDMLGNKDKGIQLYYAYRHVQDIFQHLMQTCDYFNIHEYKAIRYGFFQEILNDYFTIIHSYIRENTIDQAFTKLISSFYEDIPSDWSFFEANKRTIDFDSFVSCLIESDMSEVIELDLQSGSFGLRKYVEEDDYLYETSFIILAYMFNHFDVLDDFLYDCHFDMDTQLYNILHHKKGFTRCIRKIKEMGLYELWKTYLEQAAAQYALGYGIEHQFKMVTQKYKTYQDTLFDTTYVSMKAHEIIH